jgi:hypothetical protein
MKILTALSPLAGLSAGERAGRQAPAAEGPPRLTVLKCGRSGELIPGRENRPTGAESYDASVARVGAGRRARPVRQGQ